MRKILIILIIVIIASLAAGCIEAPKAPGERGKINVVATFYPLYEFSKDVGSNRTDVSVLVPAGVEPHDWEPGTQDIIKIESARIFVYNGAGFEPYVDGIIKRPESRNLTIVDSSQGIPLIQNAVPDPHIWLDPVLAKQQVDNIEKAFIKADPQNRDYYSANARMLKQELDALDKEISTGLASAKKRVFITSHNAFGYFARRYNLTQIAIAGLSPDTEPSPAKIADVVRTARENGVKYIFFETLANPKLSQVIANEAGAQTLVLNPIEGISPADLKQGKNYFTEMRENLKNLTIALEAENG